MTLSLTRPALNSVIILKGITYKVVEIRNCNGNDVIFAQRMVKTTGKFSGKAHAICKLADEWEFA